MRVLGVLMTVADKSVVPELYDVTLRASNVEELGQFYTKLGLRQAVDHADVKVFILGVNELEIQRAEIAQDQAVTIQVRVPQIGPLALSLTRQAIRYEGPQSDELGLSLVVRDPNGNRVSFVQHES